MTRKTIVSLFVLLIFCNIHAQNELDVVRNNWLQYSDIQNSLYHHLADQAMDLLAKRAKEVDNLNSLQDWQKRQEYIRSVLTEITGPFPAKTPLNAKIVRRIDKEYFSVEHIIFESQPGFFVTSSLYIPKGLSRKTKAPAIIYCSGHSEEGYRSPVYQYVITNLVHKGFIVFAFDPVGQGERLEYFDQAKGKSIVGGPTNEHSYPGNQAFITGSSQARHMIWDGIRAIDYLVTRKEVDPSRIGITGRSGGGTQSSYIAAFDDRIWAAAPECYITTFTRLLQTMGNQDAEQNFPSFVIKGLDLPDLLSVRAPKPALMITTTRDIFSIQGAREAEEEINHVYEAYGKRENFGRAEDDTGHASTMKNREAMYAFFQKHLKNPGDSKDMAVSLLTKEELKVTSSGQISTSIKGETVFTLNMKELGKVISKRDSLLNSYDDKAGHILNAARRLSGYIDPVTTDKAVFSGRFRKEGYSLEKYFIKGEGNYVVPYLLLVPDNFNGKAVIYLNPRGKSAEAGGEMEILVKAGYIVLAPDLIGIGETGPGIFRGDAYIEGESHNLWYASIVIGRSIVAIRAADVNKLVNQLKQVNPELIITGIARSDLAPVLLHAAGFNKDISGIVLLEPYSSYSSLIMNRYYKSSFIAGVVPGAIEEYDLPHLAGSLAPRKLMVARPTDGNGGYEKGDIINDDLNTIKKYYKENNAEGSLLVLTSDKVFQFEKILSWIK